jgi:hypothetical protein
MSFIEKIEKAVPNLARHPKNLFLLLTVITGVFTLGPYHNFQPYLAQGDHGRDLYSYKAAMEGALPYRDYSSEFGPLMPYYYSLFYRLFGVKIQSVLLGYNFLILTVGIVIYLACAVFLPPFLAYTCAIWYWAFRGMEFFYTYNHVGGLLAMLSCLYCLFLYIRTPRSQYVYPAFLSLFLLLLIRLNLGVTSLIVLNICLIVTDIVKKNHPLKNGIRAYAYASLAALVAAAVIYWLLLSPLPGYILYECFPFIKSHRTDVTATPADAILLLGQIILANFNASWLNRMLGVFIVILGAQACISVFQNKIDKKIKIDILLVFFSLAALTALTLHEFLGSGVYYRLTWTFSLLLIALFYLIFFATLRSVHKDLRALLTAAFLSLALFSISQKNFLVYQIKHFGEPLRFGDNEVFTLQNDLWRKTVTDVSGYIIKNTGEDEKIFVLPFDPLYYFLTGRGSASRQLIFFEHKHITEEQEKNTIADLMDKNVNWILISSRAWSDEPGMGRFGETYCLLLSDYIRRNFQVVLTAGDWQNPPGWAWNHGVLILKRINE